MKTETLKTIVRLLPIASQDATRYALCGVRIVVKSETDITLVACDGHKLVEVKTEDNLPVGDYFFTSDQVKAAKLLLKDLKRIECLEAVTDNLGRLAISSVVSSVSLTIPKADCEYPNYKQIVPVAKETDFLISFNAEYLYELMKALKEEGDYMDNVKLRINGPEQAIYVTKNNHSSAFAVLMPCRL